jgi:WD40 repeat protein
MRRTRATLACAALLAATLTGFASTTPSAGSVGGAGTVMFVGNNWDGTADLIDPASLTTVGTLNVIPDYAQRMAEIQADPVRLAYFLAIRQQVGEGHDQYVDDMFSTDDGALVAVSRPSFADVVGIDLRTRKIAWRFAMHGQRADHMAISPDGSRLLVSDSTANHVDELDIRTGQPLRQFASGDTPHESNYSTDGSRIFHASIGRIYTPTDPSQFCPLTDPTKGDQRFEIVDNQSFEILHTWDIGQKLRDAGFSCMSSAVRPMAISPDEKTAYLQISFFHGYVVFDLEHGVVRQVVSLPQSEQAKQTPKSQYVLNSAHHGLAINASGTQLCVAGTMDDYVGLVPIARPERPTILPLPHTGDRPYWATNGPDGSQCWVSVAGDDRVNVYDYASRSQVGSVQVGDHPQRVRVGHLSDTALAAWQSGDSPFVPPAR